MHRSGSWEGGRVEELMVFGCGGDLTWVVFITLELALIGNAINTDISCSLEEGSILESISIYVFLRDVDWLPRVE